MINDYRTGFALRSLYRALAGFGLLFGPSCAHFGAVRSVCGKKIIATCNSIITHAADQASSSSSLSAPIRASTDSAWAMAASYSATAPDDSMNGVGGSRVVSSSRRPGTML